ncbi:ABC transporter permease subunit [Glaciibacter psychrotolerans]|uniref:ABC-2 type transport system permease protein n=1 Tax=Glaciibacter psychrotolerans TaxID=670054 RepID=A0A7Z0ECS6_9MICO|nr:ABC transporter permease subunit [Leifsonia psychrotolerans]NYJ19230.1 ABC-2 type transport system permease protein [Leifsonia psychrotolerans]
MAIIRRATFSTLIGKAVTDRAPLAAVASFYILVIGALIGLLWPPLREAFQTMPPAMTDLVAAISGGTDLSTSTGWANAELLSVLAPAAAIVVGVMSAAAASAGEEENKTLGLNLSTPIGRSAFLTAKIIGMGVLVVIVAVCVGLGLLLGTAIGTLGFTTAGMTGAAAHTLLLGILFGTLGFLIGAATGSKRLATLVPTVVAVLAFAANTFLPLNASLAVGQKFSPWYYYLSSDPLAHGANGGHLALLAGVSLALAVAAVLVFRTRDLRG